MDVKLSAPNAGVVISGRSVCLRPISEQEVNGQYISWLNDPKINEFLEVRHNRQTIGNVVEYINGVRSKAGCEVFAIFLKAGKTHVGNIAIIQFNPFNQGYAIFGLTIGEPKAQMVGAGGEATLLIVDYIFRSRSIRRIQGGVYSDNQKSRKMLESLGFKEEGVFRKHVVLNSGKLNDLITYGLLREEWEGQRVRFSPLLKYMSVSEV